MWASAAVASGSQDPSLGTGGEKSPQGINAKGLLTEEGLVDKSPQSREKETRSLRGASEGDTHGWAGGSGASEVVNGPSLPPPWAAFGSWAGGP